MQDLTDELKQWLEGQLETVTEEGGNDILAGVTVIDVDPAYHYDTVKARLSNGRTYLFSILEVIE